MSMEGFQIDPWGQMVSPDGSAMLNMLPYAQMTQDPNALPPFLDPAMRPIQPPPIPQDPNSPLAGLNLGQAPAPTQAPAAAPEKGFMEGAGDMAKKVGKAAGNLTPDQVKSIQTMTGMAPRSAPPPAAAAIPRGQVGNMQQLGMAAPAQRKTLGQLINNR